MTLRKGLWIVALAMEATFCAFTQAQTSYFRQQGNIPLANMIYVQVDTIEDIDSTAFVPLRSQIENHLVSLHLLLSPLCSSSAARFR